MLICSLSLNPSTGCQPDVSSCCQFNFIIAAHNIDWGYSSGVQQTRLWTIHGRYMAMILWKKWSFIQPWKTAFYCIDAFKLIVHGLMKSLPWLLVNSKAVTATESGPFLSHDTSLPSICVRRNLWFLHRFSSKNSRKPKCTKWSYHKARSHKTKINSRCNNKIILLSHLPSAVHRTELVFYLKSNFHITK